MLKQSFLLLALFSFVCLTACQQQHQTSQEEASNQSVPTEQPVNHLQSDTTANTVEIVEKTVVIPGKDKAEAVFYLPVVKGNIDAAVLKKINDQLSLKSLTDESADDIQNTFAECGCGIVGSSYDVNYNKNAVLDITVFIETVGAYASGYARRLTFDIAAGEKLTIEQLLKPESLAKLAAQCDQQLQDRIKTTLQETVAGEEGEWVKELLQGKKFEVEHLQNFTVSEEGISFHYPFDFPHAALALEPDNAFHLSFAQLASYINPNSRLGHSIAGK